MMPTPTYELIAETTLASAGQFTFTSIPNTYKDLVIEVIGRTVYSTDQYEAISIRYNDDAGANYADNNLFGTTTAASGYKAASTGSHSLGRFNNSYNSNTTPSYACTNILSYANTSITKGSLSHSAATAEVYPNCMTVGMWFSTSAVTKIQIYGAQSTGNFVAGTVARLWGVRG